MDPFKQVGQHLNDKAGLVMGTSFPDFNYDDQMTLLHIAATRQRKNSTLLFEEFSVGYTAIPALYSYERSLLPRSLRDSLFANAFYNIFDSCFNKVQAKNPLFGPGPQCVDAVALYEAKCVSRAAALFSFVSEPTSIGEVTLDGGLLGSQLRVHVNYVNSPDDIESLGALGRSVYDVLSSVTGPSAPQTPCEDPTDAGCFEYSCPDLLKRFYDRTRGLLSLVDGKADEKLPKAPASTVFPHYVEQYVSSTSDDRELGELLKRDVVTPQHFAGTAAVGRVLESDLKVKECTGLYVADASALTKTPRINPMPTVMLLGRIAGLRFLESFNGETQINDIE